MSTETPSLEDRLKHLAEALDAASVGPSGSETLTLVELEDVTIDATRQTHETIGRPRRASAAPRRRVAALSTAAALIAAAALWSSSQTDRSRVTVAAPAADAEASLTDLTIAEPRPVVGDATDPDLTRETTTTAVTVPDPIVEGATPVVGEPVAVLTIDAIDAELVVVEGVATEQLKKGPGHYPDSAMPGSAGNTAIAGHRTTYGAPFHRLDELEPGDEIVVATADGSFTYSVLAQADGSASLIVDPAQVDVLRSTDRNLLTLTTNHPKYSARQRLIIQAELQPPPDD